MAFLQHCCAETEPSRFFVHRANDNLIEIALPPALTAAEALVLAAVLIRAADRSFDYGAFQSVLHALHDHPSLEPFGRMQQLP